MYFILYKMQFKNVFKLSLRGAVLLVILLLAKPNEGFAQIFTFTPSAAGCNGTWGNASCWTVTSLNVPTGCTSNTSPPPFNNTTANRCQIQVVINDNLTLTGNITLGGNFRKITIGNGATLTVTGNLTFSTDSNVTIETKERGRLVVLGASGILMDRNSTVTVDGDETGRIEAKTIDFANGTKLNLNPKSAIYISGETKLSGNGVELNILGLFRTNDIDIAGQATLNMNSPGLLLVENNFKMQGSSSVLIRGLSIVEVGGEFQSNSNNIILEVEPTAKFYVCGGIFNPDSLPPAVKSEIEEGADNCRILPVVFESWSGAFDPKERVVRLEFSTASQKGLSHFEIERSINGLENFQVIDSIPSMIFSDEINNYSRKDSRLPLSKSTLYYRITAVDMEGNRNYSDVISVFTPSLSSSESKWLVFPNPTIGDDFNLDYLEGSNYQGGQLEFRLIYRNGQTELYRTSNLSELQEQVRTALAEIPKGVIILDLYWEQGSEKLKILKN